MMLNLLAERMGDAETNKTNTAAFPFAGLARSELQHSRTEGKSDTLTYHRSNCEYRQFTPFLSFRRSLPACERPDLSLKS